MKNHIIIGKIFKKKECMFFMFKKKLVAMALAGVMMGTSLVPAFATNLVNSTSSDFSTNTNGQDVTQNKVYTDQEVADITTTTYSETYNTEVYQTKASSFSFVIPKTITLDGETNIGTYQVKVKGNITGAQEIHVTTPNSFTLYEQNAGIVKDNTATAVISSEAEGGAKTVWNQSEIDMNDYSLSKSTTTGVITSDLEKAGSYKGTFDFTVELTNNDGSTEASANE